MEAVADLVVVVDAADSEVVVDVADSREIVVACKMASLILVIDINRTVISYSFFCCC